MTATERSAKRRAEQRLMQRERAENGTNETKTVASAPLGDQQGVPVPDLAEEREMPEDPDGSKQASTVLVSGGGRESAPDATATLESPLHVQPPGRTSKRARRGTLWHFVPEDWTIKPAHRTLALGLLIDVEAEAAKFREHEFTPPRSDADRAFSGWLRRSNDFKRAAAPRLNGHDAVFERARRIQAEEAAKVKTITVKGIAAE